ncbi:uracil-DNA glycosylase family protein [Fictibacillus halophilus]|uniref:uracil-DNA glycosylase family protein n=1 Tax=Fictibacillus halophilus TaxID=1610490 RepID=UPI001CFB3982|nr:uracil-DNA glycosylase family protein [Fictibacillus halophilus]
MLSIKEFFEKAKASYSVPDIVQDPKMIFILESPHKEELKAGVPLAGLSGRSMAKELFLQEDILPMGKHLKQLAKNKRQIFYGIVNVCPFPLQESAYPDRGFVKRFKGELQIAEAIRKSSASQFRDEDKKLFNKLLIQDFRDRFIKTIEDDSIIVPCGKFAERYVNQLAMKDKLNIIKGVPHPSYNSWSRERYKDVIQTVRDQERIRTS